MPGQQNPEHARIGKPRSGMLPTRCQVHALTGSWCSRLGATACSRLTPPLIANPHVLLAQHCLEAEEDLSDPQLNGAAPGPPRRRPITIGVPGDTCLVLEAQHELRSQRVAPTPNSASLAPEFVLSYKDETCKDWDAYSDKRASGET